MKSHTKCLMKGYSANSAQEAKEVTPCDKCLNFNGDYEAVKFT